MIKTTDELVKIASAGGGFSIDATKRPIEDIIRIASAASSRKSRITVLNVNMKTTDELVQIASAGNGCVVFDM
ncbi:hypothetical protein BMS3Abin10_01623 [bacterium BMS3Abin10]|nr:hypothetical protein BMS3Abin10_01623 [bacterium BMS3Abin10]